MKQKISRWFSAIPLFTACIFGTCVGAEETKLPEIRSFTMTVPAKIVASEDKSERLFIEDGQRSFQFFWASHEERRLSPFPFLLEAGKTYTFTVEERPILNLAFSRGEADTKKDEPGYFWSPILIRVMDGEKSLFDLEMCEVHHCKMERKEVPIHFGLIRLARNLPTLEQEKALFPHRREYVLGGCLVMQKKTETMYVCPQCKADFAEWEKNHPQPAE